MTIDDYKNVDTENLSIIDNYIIETKNDLTIDYYNNVVTENTSIITSMSIL